MWDDKAPSLHFSQLRCAPRENSRRAQQGHTKCGKVSYDQLWPHMAKSPCAALISVSLLWLDLVGYGLQIVVHPGEVQGSIPCASTIVVHIQRRNGSVP